MSVSTSRIKKSGGWVTWNSLGQPHVNGRLAMTRAIGDFDLKSTGVIAEPETKRISVSVCRHHLREMIYCAVSECIHLKLHSIPYKVHYFGSGPMVKKVM